MKILGIDPGTIVTGYSCIEITGQQQRFSLIDLGIIRPPREKRLSMRYLAIFQSIEDLLLQFKPTHIVIEMPFIHKNPQTALKLGGAVGVILVAAELHKIEIFGYSPTEIKKGVLGSGAASKEMILLYLSQILRLKTEEIRKLDATDALASAVHHAQEIIKGRYNSCSIQKENKKICTNISKAP